MCGMVYSYVQVRCTVALASATSINIYDMYVCILLYVYEHIYIYEHMNIL